jgi:5-methylcytosine-specific restriction endonuclease McrA
MRYDDFIPDADLIPYLHRLNGRARALDLEARLTLSQLRDRILSSGGRCEWCGVSIVLQSFEIDHITSLSQGGDHQPDNLAIACPSCNRAKASKHPARYAQEIASRSPNTTPLVQRILDAHGMTAHRQRSLFDAPASDDETATPASDDDDDPPPYIWS